jgi:endonuclease YncB( thermonuclease family)
MEITNSSYQKLLTQVKQKITQTQTSIIKTITRQKVVMAWQVGELIDQHLLTTNTPRYGKNLINQLSKDTQISDTVLYKMRKFYQSYPALPEENSSLNWSHYRNLSSIKEESQRKYLENLAIKNNWASQKLIEEIKINKDKNSENDNKQTPKTISPIRGQLFTYPLVNKKIPDDKKLIDCGFGIYKDFAINTTTGTAVLSAKTETGNYSFEEIDTDNKKLNIYKAYLERVVDGDTIRVILDLGFNIYHHKILRLKGINAPELKTKEGEKSYKIMSNILQNTPFLIIKTIKVDIFGRYVADIFFDDNKNAKEDPQQVANKGVYLNQLLLDKGAASIF